MTAPLSAPAGAFVLHLAREHARPESTIGRLFVDGVFQWWSREDALQPWSDPIPGETCIPAGAYRIVRNYSLRFKRLTPLLVGVPGFGGVRLCPGVVPGVNTAGCILPGGGYEVEPGTLTHSRVAYEAIDRVIQTQILKPKPVWIEIVNPSILLGRRGGQARQLGT